MDRDPTLMESPHRRKSNRKSWVDQSPVDPMTDIAREETLLLTHFTKKPTICFGKVKVGKTLIRKLYVTNPHDYDQCVLIEKFPHDMNFTVDQKEFIVPGESTLSLKLTWTPENEGGCRQMVRFLVDDSYRLQAVLYGTAEVPRQKKVAKRGLMSKSVKKPFSVLHTPNLANLKTYNTSMERETVSAPTNVRRALLSSKENLRPPVKKSSLGKTKSPPRIRKGKSENRNPSDEFGIPPVPKRKSADPEPKVRRSVQELYHVSQSGTNSPEIVSCVSYDDSPEQHETNYTVSVEEHSTVSKYEYVETEEQVTEVHALKIDQWKACEEACVMDSRADISGMQIFDYAMCKRQKQSHEESVAALSPRRETYLVKKQASQRRRSWRNRISSPTIRATIPDMVNIVSTCAPSFTPNVDEVAKIASATANVTMSSPNFLTSSPIQNRSLRNVTFQSEESNKSSGLVYNECSVLSSCNSKERPKERPAAMVDQPGETVVSPKSDDSISTDSLNSKNSSASSVEALLTGKVDPATEKVIKATAGLMYDFRQVQATPALPEKPNPQRDLRSTHIVKEPKMVTGQGKLKQKQLFSKGPSATPRNDVSYARPIDERTPLSQDVSFARPLDDTKDFPAPKKTQVKTAPAVRNSLSSRVRAAQRAVRMTNRDQLSQSVHEQLSRSQKLEAPEKSKGSYLTQSARSTVKSMKRTEITKTRTKSYYSPKKCGVAQSRLVLGKREKTVIPKHPMPFASKNIYYDDRWMQKQEWSFTHWFNFILTPVEDYKLRNCPRVDAGSLVFNCKKDYHLAPSKEVLSFEAYAARRRLNRLRKLACRMFQSPDIVKVVRKVEVEIDSQRLVVRKDRPIHADIGLKQNILNWILSYNPLWLRIGLEMVYGEVLLIESNTDILGLSKFIITRLVGNPDIASQFAHPSVPHLYREGYQAALSKHTLKKFLILVYFLDYAKRHRLIEHDPCLFCKDSEIKASRDFLLNISRDFLSGEGDVTRHLSYFGYVVSYVQTSLDEFDYAVTNLATDLRDGVRLTRVVEVLTGKWGLTKGLRAPAISRLQKIHNLEKVLKALSDRGMNLDLDKGKICAKDLVDGHREKTLTLLWRIVTGFQVDILLDYKELDDEIACLNRSLKRKIQIWKAAGVERNFIELNSRRSSVELNLFENAKHRLLFAWVQAVCSHYGLKIENFTVSFSDGRVLCYLIHHYYPGLLPLSEIRQKTTVTYINECESQQQDSDNSFEWMATSLNCSPRTGKPKVYQELLANEAENFKLIAVKVSQVGGVPTMLRHSDMSNTIPDEKVVITYVTYLAIRLLEIRHESRAAIIIQLAWRKYQLRKQQRFLKLKAKNHTPILNTAEILQQETYTPEQSSPLRMQTPTSIKTAIIPLSENSGDRHIGRSINDYSPIRPIDMEPTPVSSKKGKTMDTILESSTVESCISNRCGPRESIESYLADDHKDISLGHKIDDIEAGDDPSISRKLNSTVDLPEGMIIDVKRSANLQTPSEAGNTPLKRPSDNLTESINSPNLRHTLNNYIPVKHLDMTPLALCSKKFMDTILESSTVDGCVSLRHGSQDLVDAEKDVSVSHVVDNTKSGDDANIRPKLNQTVDLTDGMVKGNEKSANQQTPSQARDTSLNRPCSNGSARRVTDILTDSRRASSQLNKTVDLTDGSLLSKSDLPTANPELCNVTYDSDRSALQADLPNIDINETFDGKTQKSDSQSNLPNVDCKQLQNETFDKICPLGSAPNSTQPNNKRSSHNETFDKETYPPHGSELLNSSVTKVECNDSQANKTFDSKLSKPELQNVLPSIGEDEMIAEDSGSQKSNISNSNKDQIHVNGSFEGEIQESNAEMCKDESEPKQHQTAESLHKEEAQRGDSVCEIDGDYNALEQQHFQNEEMASNERRSSGCEETTVQPVLNQTIELDDHSRGCFSEGPAVMASLADRSQQNLSFDEPKPSEIDEQTLDHLDGPDVLARSFDHILQNVSDGEFKPSEIDEQILDYSKGRFSEGPALMARSFDHSQQNVSGDGQEILDSHEEDNRIINSELNKTTEYKSGGAVDSESLGGAVDSESLGGAVDSESLGGAVDSESLGGAVDSESLGGAVDSESLGGAVDSESLGGAVDSESLGGAVDSESLGGEDDVFNDSYVCQVQNESVSFSRLNKTVGEDDDLNDSFVCQVQYDSVSFSRLNKTAELEKSHNGSTFAIQQSFEDGGHVGNCMDMSCNVDSLQNGLAGADAESNCDGAVFSENQLQQSALGESDEEWIEEEFILKMSRARTKEMIADRESPEPSVGQKDSSSDKAAQMIQNAFRGYAARKRYLSLKNSAIAIQRWYRCRREIKKARENYESLKAATIIIQSTVRAYQERKRFLQKKKCILSLQQKRRALVAMRSARSEYLAKMAATKAIQRWHRAVSEMRKVKGDFQRTKNAVVKIQSLVRMKSQQREFLEKKGAAISIQKWYQSLRMMQEAKENYTKIRIATLQIQALFRAHRQRKQFMLEKESALRIQKAFRMFSARKQFLDYKNSAVTIQQWYRCQMEMKKARQNYQDVKAATLVIQSAVRAHLTRKRFLMTKRCLISLQQRRRGLVLMRSTRTEYLAKRRSIKIIQRWYTAVTKMRKAKDDYQNTRNAIIKIQSLVRQRNKQREFLQRKNAALCIQNWFQTVLLMKDQRHRYVSLKNAAIQIQASFRCHRQRKAYLLQRESALKIQSVFRKFSAQKRYLCCRSSAVTIQRWYRSVVAMRKARKDFGSLRAATLVIQSNVKAYQERRRFLQKRKCVVAMQQRRRALVAMRTSRTEYLAKRCASKTLQRWYRAVNEMKKVRGDFEKTRNAVVKIQSLVRMRNQQREFLKKKEATVYIQKWYQSVWMMRDARDSYVSLRKAAIQVQALFRARRQRKQFLLEKQNALKIQDWYRGICSMRLARDRFLSQKSSAIKIQQAYKAYCWMRTERKNYLSARLSIIKLQSQTRKVLARRCFLEQRQSAIIIQKWYCSAKLMMDAMNVYRSKRSAAIKLQSTFRGYLQRKAYLEKRSCIISAQSVVRMWIERRKWLAMRSAAILIQRNYRKRLALRRLRETVIKRQEAATRIQLWFREKLVSWRKKGLLKIDCDCCSAASLMKTKKFADIWLEKTRRRKLNAVCLLQKYWRKWFQYRKSSATTIQRIVRGWLVRRRLAQQKSAAVVIQKSLRCWHARTTFKKTKEATHLLQPVIRGWLVRNQIKKQNHAATAIQSLWRAYKVRCSTKHHPMTDLRKRLVDVTKKATADKKLSNRFALGFDHLMKYKQLSEVLQALVNLEVGCRLSPVCCVQLAEGNAAPVIFTIIRGCNRSVPHMELIKYSIQILLNLAKYAPTIEAVYDSRPDAIDIILNVLMVFREKGLIFSKSCILLGIIALDMQEKGTLDELLLKPQFKEKILSLYKLTERKYKREETRVTTRARMVAVKDSAVFSEFCMSEARAKIGPDWLLGKKHLREFKEPLKAMTYLLHCLNLHTEVQSNTQKKTRASKW